MADDEAAPKNADPVAGCLMVSGVIVVCLGLMFFNLVGCELVASLNRHRYVATELVVAGIDNQGDDASVFGVVAATGEEITHYQIPPEFVKFSGPRSMIGVYPTSAEVQGRRVPIWYNSHPPWAFTNTRVLYRSAYPELPGAGVVLRTVLIQAVVIAVGVVLIRQAAKRSRKLAANGDSRSR